MDLEMAYDTIDWLGCGTCMLRVHGGGGNLFEAVWSFHLDYWACVRVALAQMLRANHVSATKSVYVHTVHGGDANCMSVTR